LNSSNSLVRPLFDGPLDIVGDIHGEIDALRNLLDHLGYSEEGMHSESRKLVFLGDLTDRGPDSPAVVTLVKSLVEGGRAQCVLGNHDLNILLKEKKHDNHWFFGEAWSLNKPPSEPTAAVLADDAFQKTVDDFFRTLPLALERNDIRVIHACWDDTMVEIARQSSDVVALYKLHKTQIDLEHIAQTKLDAIDKKLEF